MMLATLRRMRTRSFQPIRSHSRENALAAATASSTSSAVACEKRPITTSWSIGDGSMYLSSRQRSSPFTMTG